MHNLDRTRLEGDFEDGYARGIRSSAGRSNNRSDELDRILFGAAAGEHENSSEEEFRLSSFRQSVREAFRKAQKAPITVMQAAIDAGVADVNVLANLAFYLHHPEMLTGSGKGEPIRRNASNFHALSQEWKFWRDRATDLLRSRPVGPQGGEAKLLEALKKVQVEQLGRSPAERLRLQELKVFIVSALGGGRFDDRYWQFSIFDGFGRERRCDFTGSISSVQRRTRPQRAVANFQRSCRSASSVQDVGRCLKEVHDAVLCNINALLGWAVHNASMGDAPIRDFAECAYLLELQAASVRKAPQSIYSCFAPLFRNVRKVCT